MNENKNSTNSTGKINYLLRLKNKATLLGLIGAVVTFVYQVCAQFGIAPALDQSMVMQTIQYICDVLVVMGVLVDPTTAGISDSKQALQYDSPKED